MGQRMRQLEHSILELGTEMYRLRHELGQLADSQQTIKDALHGIKSILDEKGVISAEDFEASIDINAIISGDELCVDLDRDVKFLTEDKEDFH